MKGVQYTMKYSNLKVIKGDLLESDCDILIHQANCFGNMGAGIAKQIKKKYPRAYEADRLFPTPIGSYERLGKYSFYIDSDYMVVNLYSQFKYSRNGNHTDYDAMYKALDSLCDTLQGTGDFKIGFPYLIGAGLAGGDPDTILSLLNKIAKKYDLTFYLYKL